MSITRLEFLKREIEKLPLSAKEQQYFQGLVMDAEKEQAEIGAIGSSMILKFNYEATRQGVEPVLPSVAFMKKCHEAVMDSDLSNTVAFQRQYVNEHFNEYRKEEITREKLAENSRQWLKEHPLVKESSLTNNKTDIREDDELSL